MIVIGTYFVQTSQIIESVILCGIVIGVLSSLVLFITSFPDHDADKAKGRKTLVISLGKQKACSILWIFPTIVYGISITAVIFEIFPISCLILLATIPLIIKSGQKLKQNYEQLTNLIPAMNSTLYFSRITGVLLIIGFLVNVG
jgi:1,4-dihydroxy-2-naphthoate octaprenyltransferase